MDTRSVLLISYHFPPRNTSASIRPAYFCKYLPEFGFEPLVVSCRQDAIGHSSTKEAVALIVAKALQAVFRRYSDRLTWVPEIFAEAETIAKRGAVAAIYSTSPPISGHILGMLLKLRTGKTWVADFQDPFAGNPFDRAAVSTRCYCQCLQRILFKYADHLIANTDQVAEFWVRQYPWTQTKVSTIWNGYDPGETIPQPSDKPERPLTLLHAGDLYGARTPVPLLTCLTRLVKAGAVRSEELLIKLVGPIEPHIYSDLEKFEELKAGRCLEYDGSLVPRNRALQLMASAAGLLLLDMNAQGAALQVPAKLYDYARVQKPILAFTASGSPSESILIRSGIPHVVIPTGSSPSQIDCKVLEFLHMAHGNGKRPNDWFTRTFNARDQARQLAAILNSLSASRDYATSTSQVTS